MMRRLQTFPYLTFEIILIYVLGILIGCYPSTAQQVSVNEMPNAGGLLIAPTNYRLNARPGQTATLQFQIANPSQLTSDARMEITSYLPEDWTYKLKSGAENPRDASEWFTERDSTIELAPGQKKTLRLKYTVPRGLTGTYWCVLNFAPRPVGSTAQRKLVVQIPLVFLVGRKERAIIKVASPLITHMFESQPQSPLIANLPVENEGLGLAVVGASGEIKNLATGRTVKDFGVTDRNLFPLSRRRIAFELPRLPDGQYRLTMRPEVGTRRLPPVTTDYVVIDNQVKPLTEASIMELPPIAIEPSAIAITAPPGGARSQTLRVTNTSDRVVTVDISPRALEQGKSGSIGLGDNGLPPGLTVGVYPHLLTLRPKSTSSARLTLRSDRTATGDLWFGLAITEQNKANAFTDMIESCLSIAGTAKPALEVVNGTVEMVDNRPIHVGFAVRNTGNQALNPVATAAVLEDGVRLTARLEVPVHGSGGILPGAELPNSVMLPPDLKAGNYVVEVSYQYGDTLFATLRVPMKVEATDAKAMDAKKPPKVQSVVPQQKGKTAEKANVKRPAPLTKK